jgi:hypothetical protein
MYELRDWAERFGVSQEELEAAVAKVGDRAQAVEHTQYSLLQVPRPF